MMEGRDPRKRTNLGVAPGTGLAPVETVDVSMLFNDSLAAEKSIGGIVKDKSSSNGCTFQNMVHPLPPLMIALMLYISPESGGLSLHRSIPTV